MQAFVINLDSATDRWAFVANSFAHTQLLLRRVPAVDAKTLLFPHRDYAEHRYRWFHGRVPNPRELACYLSHIKAIESFLGTDESHAVIAEDDVTLRPDFDAVIQAALHSSGAWNILRLSALGRGSPVRVARLCGDYSLCVNLGRLKGSGAYLVDRRAAAALRNYLLPMRLPYDHALDREWCWGLRALSVLPFPATQNESPFLSSVQPGTYPRLSRFHRCLGTYPYQSCNEFSRWIYRGSETIYLKAQPRRFWVVRKAD